MFTEEFYSDSDLLVTSDGAVRIVTMNRPDCRNAINEYLHVELTRVWAVAG
jgi:enoyl-CoA hydratase/carnithine racemase